MGQTPEMNFDEPGLYVHILPSALPMGGLRRGTAVVIDVLRATTVIAQVLRSGCDGAIPCLEIDDARRVASGLPSGRALMGGERRGLPIEGFDLGNSPGDFSESTCRGRTLVITTTNGTRAVIACRGARRVLAAGFVNLAATARALRENWLGPDPEPLHLVCAGTDGQISLEDTLLAGSLAHVLSHRGDRPMPLRNDAARLAVEAAPRDFARLPAILREGQGGRNLIALGLGKDIEFAARVDSVDVVAELDGVNPEAGFRLLRPS